MAASVPSSGALIAHLVSRVESDLSFLASHNLVTASELQQIRSTLSEAQVRANGAALELLALRSDPAVSTVGGANAATMVPVAATTHQQPPPPPPSQDRSRSKPQCKAIWDYSKSQVSPAFRAVRHAQARLSPQSERLGDCDEAVQTSLSPRSRASGAPAVYDHPRLTPGSFLSESAG